MMNPRFYHISTWQYKPKDPKRVQIDFSDDWHIMAEFTQDDGLEAVAHKLYCVADTILNRAKYGSKTNEHD
jgi:hypothetical protein